MNRVGRFHVFVVCLVLGAAAWTGCDPEGEECFELTGTLVQVTTDTLTTNHVWPTVSADGTRILFATDFWGAREYDDKEALDFAVIDTPAPGEVRTPKPRLIDVDNARRVRLPTTIPGDPGEQPFEPNERTKTAPTWHPDGETFAGVVQNGNTIERIYIMHIDFASAAGSEVPVDDVQLMNDGAFTRLDPQWFYDAPAFSPDGQWLAYSRFFFKPGNENAGIPEVSRPMTIYAYNFATGDTVKVTPGAASENHPSWSPDGTKIVFDSNRSGANELWVIDFDPNAAEPVVSSLRRLTNSNRQEVGGTPVIQAQSFDPTWTTSNTIVFTSTRRAPCSSQRGRNLWQILPDGSDVRIVFFTREDDHYPTADPSNGRTVVFSTMINPVEAFNGQKTDLYVLRNF